MDARDEHGRTGASKAPFEITKRLACISMPCRLNAQVFQQHTPSPLDVEGVLKVSTAIPAIHPEILVPAFNPPQIADIAVPSVGGGDPGKCDIRVARSKPASAVVRGHDDTPPADT